MDRGARWAIVHSVAKSRTQLKWFSMCAQIQIHHWRWELRNNGLPWWQKMKWLDGVTKSMDMSLNKSRSWWWTGKPGVLQSLRSQRVRYNRSTELNWTHGSMIRNPPAMQETLVQPLHREDPLKEELAAPPVFLPEKSCGRRSLVGYGPWGHKELDMAEHTKTKNSKKVGSNNHRAWN